jgi:hypothetical protein
MALSALPTFLACRISLMVFLDELCHWLVVISKTLCYEPLERRRRIRTSPHPPRHWLLHRLHRLNMLLGNLILW